MKVCRCIGGRPSFAVHLFPRIQCQQDYIARLARNNGGLGGQGVDAMSERMFGQPVAELSGRDASSLIDLLRDLRTSEIDPKDIGGGTRR